MKREPSKIFFIFLPLSFHEWERCENFKITILTLLYEGFKMAFVKMTRQKEKSRSSTLGINTIGKILGSG